MIDKLKNLKWHLQLVILVSIAAFVYLGVWYFVTSDTRAKTAELNDQIAQLQMKNEAARIATQRINEFRTQFAAKTQEYDELKVLLPEQREITNVLQGMQDSAKDSRLIVMRFSPRDDTQVDAIMSKPVEVEVDSNFTNLRAFFDKIAKLPRIVSVTDFKLNQLDKQSAEKTLHAQFLLTAYYAGPENLAPKPVPGQPGGPPAPGQPAPTAIPQANITK
jgi:type IV pilus assembly protein PilO